MTEERNILLFAKGISGGYGRVPILHGIDLDVGENEVVGVLGHNGMGKTTLLKTLMGFLPTTAGQLRFDHADITRLPPNARGQMGIGYVPQGRGIFPQLSVRDNLRFAWHDYGGGSETEVMESVLRDFPRLTRLLDRDGGALSGGEQQLLALARCLMGDPEFLLLDEPTEGIQPSIIEEMSETLLRLRESRGLSILLVEQNFDFIADLSDRVLVLERGRITGTLTRAELSDQTKVDQFLGFGAARGTRQGTSRGADTSNSPRIQSFPPPSRPASGSAQPQLSIPTVTSMTIKRPTLSQMRTMADRFGMSLSDEDLLEYMNGSSIMEGYTPEIDATIVTRMLDEGAVIAGKAHCENFCLSGGSHTNAKGPIHNPWKRGYMAGGSSAGSGALVAAGEVDMAIAGDQGGSIRIPASNCGVYGMKPTHGLVPYTGTMPIEQTIDHLGPITNNVSDNALLLEVLAGEDGLDPRQYKPKTYSYTEALGRGAQGMRIGILSEGFAHPNSESDVDQCVMAAAERFRELGAGVDEVSVPEHYTAMDAWTAITLEGLQDGMMWGNSTGTNYRGLFLPSMTDHMAQWKGRADELSHSLKACMFVGEHFQRQYRGRFYGKAQNIMRKVNERYHAALKQYDLLLMPTLPIKPQEHPPADCSLSLYVQRAFEMVPNTAPFNGGLPAMSVPCGLSEGLPIGMQLVGPNYGEMKIYQAAHAFEQSGDWRDM